MALADATRDRVSAAPVRQDFERSRVTRTHCGNALARNPAYVRASQYFGRAHGSSSLRCRLVAHGDARPGGRRLCLLVALQAVRPAAPDSRLLRRSAHGVRTVSYTHL